MSKPSSLRLTLQPLTPLWTGDAERRSNVVKASSLLGGLRFWTEALLRSFGHYVCDITGNDKCVNDSKNKKKVKPVCAACRIFGCTGLARSFSFLPICCGDPLLLVFPEQKIQLLGKKYIDFYEKEKTPNWFFAQDAGVRQALELRFTPLRPLDPKADLRIPEAVLTALYLLVRWGSFGGKTPFGHGVFKLSDSDHNSLSEIARQWVMSQSNSDDGSGGISFRDFFFFSADPDSADEKIPFELRYDVRAKIKKLHPGERGNPIRHYFCGKTSFKSRGNEQKAQSSKYKLALIDGKLRGWGWFPREGTHAARRDDCLGALHDALPKFGKQIQWIEFKSTRAEGPGAKEINWSDYLEKLL